jgi:hypothetical protein
MLTFPPAEKPLERVRWSARKQGHGRHTSSCSGLLTRETKHFWWKTVSLILCDYHLYIRVRN